METDRHTRMVGWLKVALPLLALAILSSLFLLADRIDPEAALPFAEVDVEDLARQPRMTAPTYAGTTSDGAALTLSAIEARPAQDGNPAAALTVLLQLDTPDGGHSELTAGNAVLNNNAKEIVLSGGVTLSSSTGYQLVTETLAARLDRTALESRAPVFASGPAGDLQAGAMHLRQDNREGTTYLLVFNQGVRLLYQPGG